MFAPFPFVFSRSIIQKYKYINNRNLRVISFDRNLFISLFSNLIFKTSSLCIVVYILHSEENSGKNSYICYTVLDRSISVPYHSIFFYITEFYSSHFTHRLSKEEHFPCRLIHAYYHRRRAHIFPIISVKLNVAKVA